MTDAPVNYKWGVSAEGDVTVFRVQGGRDGKPYHRSELARQWGRPPRVLGGDVIGAAQFRPAEVRLDGEVIAPSSVAVQTYYSGVAPPGLMLKLREMHPGAEVRETAQSGLSRWALGRTAAEEWGLEALHQALPGAEELVYKWVYSPQDGFLIWSADGEGGRPWHVDAVREAWQRDLTREDVPGYAVPVSGGRYVEGESYKYGLTLAEKQAIRAQLREAFPDSEILMEGEDPQTETPPPGPDPMAGQRASAAWAREHLASGWDINERDEPDWDADPEAWERQRPFIVWSGGDGSDDRIVLGEPGEFHAAIEGYIPQDVDAWYGRYFPTVDSVYWYHWPRGERGPLEERVRRMAQDRLLAAAADGGWRLAGMTPAQVQAIIEERELPEDRSEVVHTLPNGYTVRRLQTYGDVRREGEIMHHCWADLSRQEDDLPLAQGGHHETPGGYYYSLRDPDNIPKASFYYYPPGDLQQYAGNVKDLSGYGPAETPAGILDAVEEGEDAFGYPEIDWASHSNIDPRAHVIHEAYGHGDQMLHPKYQAMIDDWVRSMGHGAPAYETTHHPDYGQDYAWRRIAGMTPNQVRNLVEERGLWPDTSETVYEFPDGWTVKRLKTNADVWREGEIMNHCWAEQPWEYGDRLLDDEDLLALPVEGEGHYSLRDPNNIPKLSFYYDRSGGGPDPVPGALHSVFGHGDQAPSPKYMRRLQEWLRATDPQAGWEAAVGDPIGEYPDNEYEMIPADREWGDPLLWDELERKHWWDTEEYPSESRAEWASARRYPPRPLTPEEEEERELQREWGVAAEQRSAAEVPQSGHQWQPLALPRKAWVGLSKFLGGARGGKRGPRVATWSIPLEEPEHQYKIVGGRETGEDHWEKVYDGGTGEQSFAHHDDILARALGRRPTYEDWDSYTAGMASVWQNPGSPPNFSVWTHVDDPEFAARVEERLRELHPGLPANAGQRHVGRTAKETLPQQLRHWESLPVNLRVEEELPGGWAIASPQDFDTVGSIGKRMHNCWQGRSDDTMVFQSEAERAKALAQYRVLLDPSGLPAVAYYHQERPGEARDYDSWIDDGPEWVTEPNISATWGPRNEYPSQEAARALVQHAVSNGYSIPEGLWDVAEGNEWISSGMETRVPTHVPDSPVGGGPARGNDQPFRGRIGDPVRVGGSQEPDLVPVEKVRSYLIRQHPDDYEDGSWFEGVRGYREEQVPISEIKSQFDEPWSEWPQNPRTVEEYSRAPGEAFPPVVLFYGSRYPGLDPAALYMHDGGHRLNAALARGDKTIKAYVPVMGDAPRTARTFSDSEVASATEFVKQMLELPENAAARNNVAQIVDRAYESQDPYMGWKIYQAVRDTIGDQFPPDFDFIAADYHELGQDMAREMVAQVQDQIGPGRGRDPRMPDWVPTGGGLHQNFDRSTQPPPEYDPSSGWTEEDWANWHEPVVYDFKDDQGNVLEEGDRVFYTLFGEPEEIPEYTGVIVGKSPEAGAFRVRWDSDGKEETFPAYESPNLRKVGAVVKNDNARPETWKWMYRPDTGDFRAWETDNGWPHHFSVMPPEDPVEAWITGRGDDRDVWVNRMGHHPAAPEALRRAQEYQSGARTAAVEDDGGDAFVYDPETGEIYFGDYHYNVLQSQMGVDSNPYGDYSYPDQYVYGYLHPDGTYGIYGGAYGQNEGYGVVHPDEYRHFVEEAIRRERGVEPRERPPRGWEL